VERQILIAASLSRDAPDRDLEERLLALLNWPFGGDQLPERLVQLRHTCSH